MTTSPAGWLPSDRDQLRPLCSLLSTWYLYLGRFKLFSSTAAHAADYTQGTRCIQTVTQQTQLTQLTSALMTQRPNAKMKDAVSVLALLCIALCETWHWLLWRIAVKTFDYRYSCSVPWRPRLKLREKQEQRFNIAFFSCSNLTIIPRNKSLNVRLWLRVKLEN